MTSLSLLLGRTVEIENCYDPEIPRLFCSFTPYPVYVVKPVVGGHSKLIKQIPS